jgi:hypothetical protein
MPKKGVLFIFWHIKEIWNFNHFDTNEERRQKKIHKQNITCRITSKNMQATVTGLDVHSYKF